MLNLILGMLSLIISKVSVINRLKSATEAFINATTDEERQVAKVKLMAYNLLFMKKFERELDEDTSRSIMEELRSLVEELKLSEYSEEEKRLLTTEMADRIIKEVAEEESLEDDDNEFHIHDCDTCGGKGQCPIEQVMRDVKAGKLSPKEGDAAIKAMVEDSNKNVEMVLPTVVAEA